jgi:hypothetical protein
MRIFLALIVALPLAGCMTDEERIAEFKARNAVPDDQTCRSYGARPGTDIYIQCRMQRQQTRDAGDNAVAAAAAARPVINGAVPPSDAPVLRPPITCQSRQVGGMVQTTC